MSLTHRENPRSIISARMRLRCDPTIQDLHHSDIITYALTRLPSQYAREKQEIVQDLRGYKSADIPASLKLTDSEAAMSTMGYSAPMASKPRGMGSTGKE